jgi:hypothetical protein
MMKDKRKRTPWFPRNTPPVRHGFYECGVRWTSAMPTLCMWVLEWDGKGFKVPMPMMVKQWRGLAKRPRA